MQTTDASNTHNLPIFSSLCPQSSIFLQQATTMPAVVLFAQARQHAKSIQMHSLFVHALSFSHAHSLASPPLFRLSNLSPTQFNSTAVDTSVLHFIPLQLSTDVQLPLLMLTFHQHSPFRNFISSCIIATHHNPNLHSHFKFIY